VAERVERPRLDEGLDRPLVADGGGDLAHEVAEGGVGAGLLAGGDDRVDHLGPHVADRGEPESDVVPHRREGRDRGVHVGREHRDVHVPALREVDREPVLVVRCRGQQRRHVLRRVVRLEVGGPVRDEAVGGGVRLVEGVVGERDEDLPEGAHRTLGVAPLEHAGLEALELLVQLGLLLLAHGPPQQVRLAEAEARHLLGDRHHLLLVDDQAVRGAEDLGERLGELRVDRLDLLEPVLAERVVVVGVRPHRPRPVQRDGRGDVLEIVRPHQPQEVPQAAAVELEDAEGVPAGEQLVGPRVIEAEGLEVGDLLVVPGDVLQRVGDHGEVPQPEEVHLQQAEFLAGGVLELGDDGAVGGPAHHGDDVGERLGGHDHGAGVHAPVPLDALEPGGEVDDLPGDGVVLVDLAELLRLGVPLMLGLEDLPDRDVLAHHRGRHGLRQLLADGVGVAEHPGRVLE